MNTTTSNDSFPQNVKLGLIALGGVVLLIGAIGFFRDHSQKKELKASNALYLAQTSSRDLLKEKKFSEAEVAYQNVLKEFPGSRAAFESELQIGDIWMDAKDFAKAASHYESAVRTASEAFGKVLAQYNLGIAKEAAGQFQEAVTSYGNALNTKGSDFLKPEILMAQARCLESLNQKQQAIEIYKNIQQVYATKTFYSGAASAFEKQLSNN